MNNIENKFICPIFIYFVVCGIFKGFGGSEFADEISKYIICGLNVLFLVYDIYYNVKILPPALAEWQKQYMCNKCGNIFKIIN